MTEVVDRNMTQDSSSSIPVQIRSIPARNLYISNRKLERKLNCLRFVEAILCGFCALLCSGNITSSVLTLSTIDHAEDNANRNGIGYQDANAYRTAAGDLMSVNIVALIFHLSVVIFPLLYPSAAVGKNFKCYILINIAVYIFFGILLLAGGISSMFYSDDNYLLWKDVCQVNDTDLNQFCKDLEIIRSTEMASAVLSFISIIIFMLLFLMMLCSGFVITVKDPRNLINKFPLQSHAQGEPLYHQSTDLLPNQMTEMPQPHTLLSVPPAGKSKFLPSFGSQQTLKNTSLYSSHMTDLSTITYTFNTSPNEYIIIKETAF